MADDMEQIYKEYAKSVYKYLFSLSHDANLAEELTQETFYRQRTRRRKKTLCFKTTK